MNREIKFRAWHKDLKKMFKIGQITLEKGTWNFDPNDRDFIGMSIPFQPSFVLMQYTGLHDKNGKEIYEGDIIKCEQYIGGNFVDYCIEKGFVEFKDGEFGLHRKQGYYQSLRKFIEYDYELEVISNVYDNPELLGGE
mgnify:CR=1 FL=1|jgi:uncharacterized phage protein (TIGR01671 family)